ncbi:hypothetical protein F8388_020152 [Cannabis sativa]|uniref:Uncharacterized protein n=1 Tax=Cannabis sativa TaxID=3483 RepID=A0A7J6I1J3_CANSA|nr:hypothetical protein F8388_020152 [Cannabis sativa]KAF4400500.1 hypothetical protein G4B88_023293 [Cannabis sativa]
MNKALRSHTKNGMLFTLSNNCKLVLNSKAKDEQLTNFAKWEPWHGKFGLYYPWGKYLQLGDHLRELASSIISLTSCLQSPKQEKYFDGLETGDLSLFLIVEILVNPEFAVYKTRQHPTNNVAYCLSLLLPQLSVEIFDQYKCVIKEDGHNNEGMVDKANQMFKFSASSRTSSKTRRIMAINELKEILTPTGTIAAAIKFCSNRSTDLNTHRKEDKLYLTKKRTQVAGENTNHILQLYEKFQGKDIFCHLSCTLVSAETKSKVLSSSWGTHGAKSFNQT